MPKDILIIGGGPAGLSTALHLARFAPGVTSRVLILEKAHYPRPKLCGGALLPDAEVILEGLGLDVSEIPHVDAAEARLDFAGRGLRVALPGGHTLRMIRRDEFDFWLAKRARALGIEIREGVTVRMVSPRHDCAHVATSAGTFEAAVVVGADGSNGVTRRCAVRESKIHTARVLEVIAPPSHVVAGHEDDVAYFDFFPVPQGIAGYTWDFPTQLHGQPMRCWGIYDTNVLADHPRPELKQLLRAEMGRHGYNLEHFDLQGHPIRWFSPSGQLSAPRIILVGDAAGADGIFGEGISIALGYGRLAAQAILAAVRSNDFSFRHYRRSILLSPLGQALAIRAGITHVLYRLHWAWFQKFFWRVFKPVVSAAACVFVLNWAKRMR